MNFKDRIIWLTGASKGIGRALAIELHKQGAKLVLSARNENSLKELAQTLGEENTFIAPLDVADRDANLHTINTIQQKFGGLDIIILNAGTAEYVDLNNFDSTVFERVMQTNFMSVVYGIEAALPLLRQSEHPHIVGMSSTAAYGGLPRSEAYGASKAAIRNMLEGLRIHLLRENIPVSIICPGFVKTPLTEKNDFPMPMLIDAEKAASIIAKGIAKQTQEIHFPKLFSLSLKFISSLPSSIYTKLLSSTIKV